MKIHEMKTLPEFFEAVDSGAKPFEVRFNDRDFKVGDRLCLREYSDGEYTGRVLHREISYVLDAPAYCKEGFVVLGLAPIERVAETSEEKRIEVRSCEDCLHYRACLVNSEYVPTPCCAYENKQGYLKQSEWISVEERLPKEDGKYIVHNRSGMVFQAKYYSSPKTWGMVDKGVNITHWMPLPEPPKKGGAE